VDDLHGNDGINRYGTISYFTYQNTVNGDNSSPISRPEHPQRTIPDNQDIDSLELDANL
jgi:hypothetical protein